MTLKTAIVKWIINHKTASYKEGLALYGQLDYNPNILRDLLSGDSTTNRQKLLKHLGIALKTKNIPEGEAIVLDQSIKTVSTPTSQSSPEPDTPEDTPDMIPMREASKVALDISNLYILRGEKSEDLKVCNTQEGRAKIMSDLKSIQKGISDGKKKKDAIAKNQYFADPQEKKAPRVDLSIVPKDPVEKLQAMNKSRVRRSKALKMIEKYEQELNTYPGGHPKHLKTKKRIVAQRKKWNAEDEFIRKCQ